jgi:2-methylcitrate dehydratase PrpD
MALRRIFNIPLFGDNRLNETNKGGSHLPALTDYVADFSAKTKQEDFTFELDQLGKKSILDAIGVSLSGSISEPCKVLNQYIQSLNCSGESTIFGTSIKVSPRFAALANGTAMHADDYDDTLQAQTGRFQGVHPTAPVLSALLAYADTKQITGRQLLTAYQVGVEVACKLFDATHINHILHGFHATATCGMLGATVGLAHLKNLDSKSITTSLGIAASQAGGLQENFGTMVKPFHAGRSAECAVVSVDLEGFGFTSSPIILEAKRGFFQALGGGFEESRLFNKLGKPWSFLDRGIWLKPYPTGSLGHPAMTGMHELVIQNDIKTNDVEKIILKTSQNIHHTLLHHRPKTELQAKFSLEFCLAALLVDRKCGLNQFNDEYVNRIEIQQAINLIEYIPFTKEEEIANQHTIVTSYISVTLKDGRQYSIRKDFGKGNKADPMSENEIADKFRECAEFRKWDSNKTENAIKLIQNIESLEDIRVLTAQLHL